MSNALIQHSSSTRRVLAAASTLAAIAVAGYIQPTNAGETAAKTTTTASAKADESIRPFKVHVPQADIDDLRRRIAETRWPDKELVNDGSQGIQTAQVQELVKYWGTQYDWRKPEKKLNALPQFVTKIDGIDIHFIHVKSRHPNALPLILTHGWPGSIFEFINTIGPLTDPTAYGGRPEDAFDVVIPSIPGYGFSERPKELGCQPDRTERA